MADNSIPEEFLLDLNKSLEMISSNQSSLNSQLQNLGNSIDDLSGSSQEMASKISESLSTNQNLSGIPNLIDSINLLNSTVRQEGENADRSAKDLFSILNPVGAATTTSFLPNIPRFAEGGTMETTGAAIVGDRGPELVLLPENSEVVPLSTDTFDRFESFLNNIQPSVIMENVLGSDRVILSRDEDGKVSVYPDKKSRPDVNFEPFSLEDRISAQIVSEENILNTPTASSIEKEESEDVLKLLDAFTQDILPTLNFQSKETIEAEARAEAAVKPAELATAENVLNQAAQGATPVLEAGTALATAVETTANVLAKAATPAETETFLEKAAPAELAVVTEKLAAPAPASPAPPPPPPPAVTTNQIVQQVGETQPQAITFPETFSVTIAKYEEGERQFAELKSMLTEMYRAISEMQANERILNASDSYPIRPINSIF